MTEKPSPNALATRCMRGERRHALHPGRSHAARWVRPSSMPSASRRWRCAPTAPSSDPGADRAMSVHPSTPWQRWPGCDPRHTGCGRSSGSRARTTRRPQFVSSPGYEHVAESGQHRSVDRPPAQRRQWKLRSVKPNLLPVPTWPPNWLSMSVSKGRYHLLDQ